MRPIKHFQQSFLSVVIAFIAAGNASAAIVSSFDFGSHPVAGTSSQALSIPVATSLNGQTLQTSFGYGTEFSTVAASCTVASAACAVTVSFAPKYAGLRKDGLRLTDGQGNIAADAFLHGTGLGPQMVFSPGVVSVKDTRQILMIAVDEIGVCYLLIEDAVYRLKPGETQLTRFAGTNQFPHGRPSGDGGPATDADISPNAIAVDSRGDLIILTLHDVRKVDHLTDIISTMAINFSPPCDTGIGGIVLDASNNIFANCNNIIAKIDAQSGAITPVAGNGQFASTGDGGPAIQASLEMNAFAVDPSGAIIVGETDGRIRRVDPQTNIIDTIAGNGTTGHTGDGGPAAAAQIGFVSTLSVDEKSNIYFESDEDSLIRKIDAVTGIISTIAGGGESHLTDGFPADWQWFFQSQSLAVDSSGNIFISCYWGFAEIVSDATKVIFTTPGSFEPPPSEKFLLTNIGNTSLQLQSQALSGPFIQALTSAPGECPYPGTLSPGTSCSVSLTYDPAQGTGSGAYTVTSNALNGLRMSQTVSLQVGFPILNLDRASGNFGPSIVNQPEYEDVYLFNAGNAPLLLHNMSFSGPNASEFSIHTPCPSSVVLPGQGCDLILSLLAKASGVRNGYLQVDDNAHNSPQIIPLTGTAQKLGSLAPSTDTLVFDSIAIGQSASKTIYLTNVGDLPATSADYFFVTRGPFTVTQFAYPYFSIQPGDRVQITITFTPTSSQPQFTPVDVEGRPGFSHFLNLVGTARAASSNYHDDTDAEIVYAGSWGHNQAPGRFGGTQSFSRRTGDSASFLFNGSQVAYVYDAQSNLGHVQVSIDGTVVSADLDEYSAVSKPQQRQIYTGLTDGPHTITVTVLGTQDTAASAPYAVVDSFLVGPAATTYDDGDPAISYSGTWGQNTAVQRYMGTQTFSNLANNQASLTFTGSQVTYIYEAQQNMGHARISIDGSVVTPDLDEYSPTLLSQQQLSYTGLSAGTHTITVTVLGTKDAGSSNTYVIVDAFLTNATSTGTYDDADPAIRYSGSWGQNTTDGRYHGTQTFSRTAGDSASFTFTGDRISYVYAAQWNLGHAQISIDNTIVTADLDEYSATSKPQQRLLYSGLGNGPHTIKVTALGTTNPNSSDSYVIIDAFSLGTAGSGTYDDADPEVGYQGNWGHNLAYGRYADTQSFSNVAGDTASFTFTGTEVAYLYAVQPNLGHVRVSIDGTVVTADLDEYGPLPSDPYPNTMHRQIYSGLTAGTHTISVMVMGFHNLNATDSYAVVDAFIAGPDAHLIDDRDTAISYYGSWDNNMAFGRFLGTQTFSDETDSYSSFNFTGTAITYVYAAQQNAGKAEISIDGQVVNSSLDEYSATTMPQQHATFSGLTRGDHRIQVKVLNDRNLAATDGYVIIDGFIVTP